MSRKTTGTPAVTRRRVAVGTALVAATALIGSGAAMAVSGGTPTTTSFNTFGLSTAVGPLKGGNSVVEIKGTNLDEVTSVSFGAVAASKVLHESSTLLYVTPPAASAAGAVPVTLGWSGSTVQVGGSTADDYTYTAGPVITTVTVTDKTMTIEGTQFTGATAVLVGDILTKLKTADVTGDTKITMKVPAVKGGSVDVSVVTPAGVGTKAGAFGATPVISKIFLGSETDLKKAKAVPGASAATGTVGTGTASTATVTTHSASTGTVVIITGSGFSGLTSLKFGAAPAEFVVVNDSALRARIPAKAATDTLDAKGQLKVDVVAARGETKSKAAKFTYFAVPVVTAVSDVVGATNTANTLTITGKGLQGAKVTFGGKAGKVASATDTSISVSTPKTASTGVAEIKVTTPNGFFTVPQTYSFAATDTTTAWPAS